MCVVYIPDKKVWDRRALAEKQNLFGETVDSPRSRISPSTPGREQTIGSSVLSSGKRAILMPFPKERSVPYEAYSFI